MYMQIEARSELSLSIFSVVLRRERLEKEVVACEICDFVACEPYGRTGLGWVGPD